MMSTEIPKTNGRKNGTKAHVKRGRGDRQSARLATPLSKRAMASVTPDQADEAVHSLLHEIDPKGHVYCECRTSTGKPVTRYECSPEDSEAYSSAEIIMGTSVTVTFEPESCLVSFYRIPCKRSPFDLNGKETPGPEIPREELVPNKPFASIDYNDPDLLKKVFQALGALGVKIPRSLGPKIKRKQQELTESVQTPSKSAPSLRKRCS